MSQPNSFHHTITYYDAEARDTLPASSISPNAYDEQAHHELHIEHPLGRGGMGTVFQAQQAAPKRHVAVKRLHPQNAHLKPLLIQEAMICGALEHPSIIPIYELRIQGEEGPQVIMKKIEGLSLRAFCAQEKELHQAIKALIQVCHALEYAHAQGVYHRDIKPENIMMGSFASVYLVDWGLAISKENIDQLPTQLVGSPAYMAPEMLSGKPQDVDPRTDVYLLGASLHEVITGTPRHIGSSMDEVFQKVALSQPYQYASHISLCLQHLCNQACAKEKDQRIQSVALFREQLELFFIQEQSDLLLEAAYKEQHLFENTPFAQQAQHFHKARFGFEQALTIWPQSTQAKEALQRLIAHMVSIHIEKNNLEAARVLLEANPTEHGPLREKLQSLLQEHAEQASRAQELQELGATYHLSKQDYGRRMLIVVVGLSSLSLLFLLASLEPSTLPQKKDLVIQSLYIASPIGISFLFFRKTLSTNPLVRQAASGLFYSVMCLCIHRFFALYNDVEPKHILVVDQIIIALGLANAQPVLKQARVLAFLSILTSALYHFFPTYMWFSGFAFSIIVVSTFLYNFLMTPKK